MTTILVPAAELVRSSFNFTVDKLRLSGPDGFTTPYYGLFKSDNNECLNAVSDRYHPHTTDDVVTLVEAAQAAFDDSVNVKCHWRNGHHVVIEPTKEQRLSVFGTADNVFPRLFISAGYDDKPFNASLGMWRDACRNMARLKQVSGTSVSIRHTKSLRSRMDELIEVFSGLKDGWKSVTEVVAEMESRQVVLADFLNQVYPIPEEGKKNALTIHRKRTEEIIQRVMSECYRTGRSFDGKHLSAFMAYNAVQGYVQHVKRRKISPMDQILTAFDDAEVAKAEALAMAM
jgi:hypothetical protein